MQTDKPLHILIVGAGIAGLTLAALMERRGLTPVIVEKQPAETFNKSGYMIGLMALGGRVFNALGMRQKYLANSVEIRDYRMYDGKGRLLNDFDVTAIFKYGAYQGISRPKLIELLQSGITSPIRFGTTVAKMDSGKNGVKVRFSDKTIETFDFVAIADGIHSPTRELVFGHDNHTYRQTGWAGWAWFVDMPAQLAHGYREYWANHGFLGLYTVENNKVGVFMGGPMKRLKKKGHATIAAEFKKRLKHHDINMEALLEPLADDPDLYFWNFHDVRSKKWVTNNVALLGDAADGFLPTAGIGASMAMDSAAALDDELSRADAEHIDFALRLYENRQQKRVEQAQSDSRTLGNVMFFNNSFLSWCRNQFLKHYTITRFMKGITKMMEGK